MFIFSTSRKTRQTVTVSFFSYSLSGRKQVLTCFRTIALWRCVLAVYVCNVNPFLYVFFKNSVSVYSWKWDAASSSQYIQLCFKCCDNSYCKWENRWLVLSNYPGLTDTEDNLLLIYSKLQSPYLPCILLIYIFWLLIWSISICILGGLCSVCIVMCFIIFKYNKHISQNRHILSEVAAVGYDTDYRGHDTKKQRRLFANLPIKESKPVVLAIYEANVGIKQGMGILWEYQGRTWQLTPFLLSKQKHLSNKTIEFGHFPLAFAHKNMLMENNFIWVW